MNSSEKLPPEDEFAWDPTHPDAPAAGDGLPIIKHNVYDCIELCCDHHSAGLLLFKLIFFCRRATVTIQGKRWYVRSRESLCLETRLTRHQYDCALSILKIFGFVETRRLPLSKVHIFGNYTAFRIKPDTTDQLILVRNRRGPVHPRRA